MALRGSLLLLGTLLTGAVLGAFACSSHSGGPGVVYGPDMNDSREEEIRGLASREINCPANQLVYSSAGGSVHRESGCGRFADFVLVCPGYCFPASIGELRRRAAYELGCQEQLNIIELQKNTFGVEGCGMRATYVVLYSMSARGPQWLMNSAAIPVPTAPAPAPTTAPAETPAPAPAPRSRGSVQRAESGNP